MSGGVLQDGSPGLMGATRRLVTVANAGTPTLTPQDDGLIVDCLELATVNLPPLANVGNGFSVLVVGRLAAGVGDEVTITPNGAETINGGATAVLTTANFEGAIVYKANDQWIATPAP